jgi:hypothetical protein
MYIYVYIYIAAGVCVCVCVCVEKRWRSSAFSTRAAQTGWDVDARKINLRHTLTVTVSLGQRPLAVVGRLWGSRVVPRATQTRG